MRLKGREISFTNSVKCLGDFLDPKLNWKQCLTEKRKKCYSCMWGYRKAMGRSWGINPRIAIWMYKTILLPKILYALVVWWPMVSKVEAKNVL